MLVKTKIRFLFFVIFLAALIFTTCDSPMGMGQPIDWEPPVLTMDPVPNPLYVRVGTVLTGTVTDNVGVDRVIFINSATGRELFPVIRNGDEWLIELKFTEEQNNEKIIGEIRAFDKMGNTDDRSCALVTMIIDIRPPIVENMTIQRTDTRIARFEPYSSLRVLEVQDRLGEKKDSVYRYQNGWFYINGVVNEDETKVEIISLDFYDTREINTKLISLSVDDGYTNYFPRWTVKEEDIINAGKAKWGESYKTNYYDVKDRYYYRVVIKAIDKSDNESVTVEEDEGYICMWAVSDEPKGILDPSIGQVVSRGTPLPVDFFDDDSLLWAYTGLLTEDQWNGYRLDELGNRTDVYLAPGVKIQGADDDEKLDWLLKRLRNGGPVYNWKYDKHSNAAVYTDIKDREELIEEQINGKKLDEKLVYVATGNGEFDYGDYRLFTFAADTKLAPHDGKGPEWTNTNITAGRVYKIAVIDENAPLIVFDTAGGCPEENTFPKLADEGNGGEFFTIKGYTLRENKSGNNSVIKFRVAWIPFNMPDSEGKPNADGYIRAVQTALSKDFAGMPDGVQYWDFTTDGGPGTNTGKGKFEAGVVDMIDDGEYNKQSFEKTFSVLGGPDDIIPATNNFTYNNALENETKLFIFYAVDNMGHEVFRQLRLLSNKVPPNLVIYDISNKLDNVNFPDMPDPNEGKFSNTQTGGLNEDYYDTLNAYISGKYGTLSSVKAGLTDDDKTVPFQIYPRGTIIKYWVAAANSGDIAVENITMTDITYTVPGPSVGYKADDMTLGFCEYYPDVTQRTFLFVATDKLGNEARIQRTIAVTNAARLENITTTTQDGTYGIGQTITLKANFSSQIYLDGAGTVFLNVRYQKKDTGYQYEQLECTNKPTKTNPALALEFNFNVREDYQGMLETTFENIASPTPEDYKRPITLYIPPFTPQGQGIRIVDYIREDTAFIPGYKNETVTMPNWTTAGNTLQRNKNILLDGVRPIIEHVSVSGKAPYSPGEYYFKTGETINFTLTANKQIRASDAPVPKLEYYIRESNGTERGPYSDFVYQRPDGQSAVVFSLPVNNSNSYQGELVKVKPYMGDAGYVSDNVGNQVNQTAITYFEPDDGSRIFIKKAAPAAPRSTADTTLGGAVFGANPTNLIYFATNPSLVINDSPNTYGAISWEDEKEYSLNGGVSWITYTSAVSITGGQHTLQVRYKDRAGNEGAVRSQLIQVEAVFPKLISVSAVQPNGWYTAKAGNNTLTFNLNFADKVKVTNQANVSITLGNRGAGGSTRTLNTTTALNTEVTSVTFNWPNINGEEMWDGLYISNVVLTGLSDVFGNTGTTGTGTYTPTNTINIDSCPNLASGIKVDAKDPTINVRNPQHNVNPAVDNDALTTITLTFSEPVMKGSGIITIRPRGNYAIPPVLRDKEYYLGVDGTTEYTEAAANRTKISSFYDIYNAITGANAATYRGYLTQGSSMSNLTLNARTGQNAGPYIKMTHGLIKGLGYEGNFSGTDVKEGKGAPDVAGLGNYDAMVPDTATKWVLDYQYPITGDGATGALLVVRNIRTALTAAKWRWQEIDVVNTTIANTAVAGTVTITLNEPLLKGLAWDVYYPAGAFTDMAGNNAVKSGNFNADGTTTGTNTDYYFTTPGVQPPVIRVNRRSYDARNANWQSTTVNYNPPGETGSWDSGTTVTADDGWGIGNFNTVHYRVESESPSAAVTAQYFEGTDANKGAVTAAWSGNIGSTTTAWTETGDNTSGTWVLTNLIRRAANGTPLSYKVITKNGTPEDRTFQLGQNNLTPLRMFRSYNRDLTKTQLDGTGVTLSPATLTNGQGVFTYNALKASKNYVVATATCNGANAKGYEGVFRTVIVFNYSSNRGRYFAVQGSNIKNGMPSIAGFPVRDAEETGDNRYNKVFYNEAIVAPEDDAGTYRRFYWVSTEIVCEWYFLTWGGGSRAGGTGAATGTGNSGNNNGTHMNVGEINNYLSVGYGDLTYGYNIGCSNISGNN